VPLGKGYTAPHARWPPRLAVHLHPTRVLGPHICAPRTGRGSFSSGGSHHTPGAGANAGGRSLTTACCSPAEAAPRGRGVRALGRLWRRRQAGRGSGWNAVGSGGVLLLFTVDCRGTPSQASLTHSLRLPRTRTHVTAAQRACGWERPEDESAERWAHAKHTQG
jgi:hypothetical protein